MYSGTNTHTHTHYVCVKLICAQRSISLRGYRQQFLCKYTVPKGHLLSARAHNASARAPPEPVQCVHNTCIDREGLEGARRPCHGPLVKHIAHPRRHSRPAHRRTKLAWACSDRLYSEMLCRLSLPHQPLRSPESGQQTLGAGQQQGNGAVLQHHAK